MGADRNCQTTARSIYVDESGLVISVELVLIAVLALIGLIAGMTSVRDACISELSDVAGTVQDVNQSYHLTGLVGHSATNAGSNFLDANDFCDDDDDVAGEADNCIEFSDSASVDGGGSGENSVTEYVNRDTITDISASQNSTTIKWEVDPTEPDAVAVTQAILDCIAGGHVAEITWTDSDGGVHTFSASEVLSDGPEGFAFEGTSSGSASGKVSSATVSCPDEGEGLGGG